MTIYEQLRSGRSQAIRKDFVEHYLPLDVVQVLEQELLSSFVNHYRAHSFCSLFGRSTEIQEPGIVATTYGKEATENPEVLETPPSFPILIPYTLLSPERYVTEEAVKSKVLSYAKELAENLDEHIVRALVLNSTVRMDCRSVDEVENVIYSMNGKPGLLMLGSAPVGRSRTRIPRTNVSQFQSANCTLGMLNDGHLLSGNEILACSAVALSSIPPQFELVAVQATQVGLRLDLRYEISHTLTLGDSIAYCNLRC